MAGMALLVSLLLGLGQRPTFQVEDLLKVVSVSEPAISPDGRMVAVVVGRVNLEEDRRDREIVLIDVATKRQRVMTRERRSVSTPRFSPDGKSLAFLSSRTAKDPEQVYSMPLDGGEAVAVPHDPEGVVDFSFSPSGDRIAYVAAEKQPEKKGPARFDGSFVVGNDPYLTTKPAPPLRLWVMPLDGPAKCLTAHDRPLANVLPPGAPAITPEWSADGKTIYTLSQESPEYGDATITNRVEAVDADLGGMRHATTHEGFEGPLEANRYGPGLAYSFVPDIKTGQGRAYGLDGADLAPKLDINNFSLAWMPDGRSILLGGHDGPGCSIWLQRLGGEAQKLALGDVEPTNGYGLDISVAKTGAFVFTGETPGHAPDVYFMGSPSGAPERLTSFNEQDSVYALGRVFELKWKTFDGRAADGIVTLPPGFDASRKYPVVLSIHGGPQSSSTLGLSFGNQILASQGYVVFSPNYRGSDNLGAAYMRAIWNDAGDGPGRDVMAGLALLEKEPYADSAREGVMGWSYGGYMTAWMISHWNKWKCASAGAAVLDNTLEMALGDGMRTNGLNFSGRRWADKKGAEFDEQSPITYVDRIKCPTQILADTGDQRVPTAQSFVLYRALLELGVPTEFVLFQSSAHSPGDPVQVQSLYKRRLAWLRKYL
jgi:dipeptidyl aminopeptidase/acylaminoacyl peptidase